MEVRKPLTKAELAKLARVGRMNRDAKTITDHYRADREACERKEDRFAVFHFYAVACLEEQTRRIEAQRGIYYRLDCEKLGGRLRVKKRRRQTGDDRVEAYDPYWSKMSDEELLELETALINARERRRI